MKRNRIILIASVCLSSLAFGQSKKINGLVVIDFKDMPASEVYVTNVNKDLTTYTNLIGAFSIEASVGDTLYFAAPFLDTRKFTVRPSTMSLEKFVVHLNLSVIELDDIVAKPKLTGYLKEDVKTVAIDRSIEKLYANLGIPLSNRDLEPEEKKQEVIPTVGGIPIPLSLNVEALYKVFSGYYRRQENYREYMAIESVIIGVKEHYGTTFFTEKLYIPETEIHNYVFWVHETTSLKSLYNSKDFFGIQLLLKAKSYDYLKRLEIRDKIRAERNAIQKQMEATPEESIKEDNTNED